jgi:TRAP-type C4-dicarboxylate transport system permease small subunit
LGADDDRKHAAPHVSFAVLSAAARAISAVTRPLGAVNEFIGVAGRNLAGLVLVAMTATIFIQVVSRYGFNNSIAWSEELSKSLMVWTAFLVAPWAYRHGANVSVDLFVEAVPLRVQAAIRIIVNIFVVWIVIVFFLESLAFVERGMQSRVATLPIRTGVFYAVLPASLFAMALTGAELLLRDLYAVVTGGKDPNAPVHFARQEG